MKKEVEKIQNELKNNKDFIVRTFSIKNSNYYIMFLTSMVDKNLVSETLIKPLLNTEQNITAKNFANIVTFAQVTKIKQEEIANEVLFNKVVVYKNTNFCFALDMENFIKRTPTEPPTSSVIQGPREGFTEDIKTNLVLLRRRFPSKNFKFEEIKVGRETKTKVQVCYLTNIADKKLVETIIAKLKKIDIDGIIDSYYLINFLQEKKFSLFKQIGTAEKPDIVSAKMLEGRIAILVDGSPIVLTLPFLYIEDIQNSNDYYTNIHYVGFIRIIRALGILVATILPGLFLSLRLYHYKVVPLKYIVTISNSTQNLPFTPFIEMLFILVLFQILYEVSLRLPQYLGLATSVVGALILGDTGVKAGLISPPTVMIIAMSLIAIYTVPDQAPQFTILRLIFIILGGTFGMLGIVAGMVYIIYYLNTLNAYGAPYLAPYSPRVKSDLKDALFKKPLREQKKRPKSFYNKNKVRQK